MPHTALDTLNRRAFLGVVTGGLLAAPLAAESLQTGKLHRIGFLVAASPSDSRIQGFFSAFRSALAQLGYVEGRNITIESRWAAGKYERLPDLAAELVRLKMDVIVAASVPAIRAARDATGTIPIIMAVVVDPVSTGLVTSLARPGRNITGLSVMTPELVGKQLEILKEIVPGVSRVGVLWNPANPGNLPQLRAAEAASRAMGLRLQPLEARGAREIDHAFATMAREGAGAVVLVDVLFVDQRTRIAHLAAARHLPAVYGLTEHVSAGGLMAYAPSFVDCFRRAAVYVDKILKGANPGDLPIEQPTTLELVINVKAARALGLTVPPSLLARSDEVIE